MGLADIGVAAGCALAASAVCSGSAADFAAPEQACAAMGTMAMNAAVNARTAKLA